VETRKLLRTIAAHASETSSGYNLRAINWSSFEYGDVTVEADDVRDNPSHQSLEPGQTAALPDDTPAALAIARYIPSLAVLLVLSISRGRSGIPVALMMTNV